jgi:hypothetical protein
MQNESSPLSAERAFFKALIDANIEALDGLLADDFLLIDVMAGSEITKDALLSVIGTGQLKFDAIEPADSRVRFYQTTALVTGSTRMRGRFGGTHFTVHSRYTHVFTLLDNEWRLVSAQGTQIATVNPS